jgi:hypothetical protein
MVRPTYQETTAIEKIVCSLKEAQHIIQGHTGNSCPGQNPFVGFLWDS